jgi:sarcosine oxidase subunit delta
MRIQCPFCGQRDLTEFTYLGAYVPRPSPGDADSPARFFDAVYVRENPAGRHEDLWYHAFGCRSWLIVTRDTRTHEIFAVELAKGRELP